MAEGALYNLLEAARWAPSGDNTQPWHFQLSRNKRAIRLELVPSRDASPMNAGQHMARIALGAALENMVQTASLNQWQFEQSSDDDSITLVLREDYSAGMPCPSIRDRGTNRKKYLPTELTAQQLDSLQTEMSPDESSVIWVTEASHRTRLSRLIGEADSIILIAEPVRKAFLEKVRFDQPVRAVVDEGLSLGSLEVSAFHRAGLRLMRWMPDVVLRTLGGAAMFRKAGLDLAKSSAGFCVVASKLSGSPRDYEIGRLFQRAWLALTRQQLASQPAMSLLVLQNMIDNIPAEALSAIDLKAAARVLGDFDDLLANVAGEKVSPGALLRFGRAQDPTVRTGRLSREKVASTIDDANT